VQALSSGKDVGASGKHREIVLGSGRIGRFGQAALG
jgi:hypothetical protein